MSKWALSVLLASLALAAIIGLSIWLVSIGLAVVAVFLPEILILIGLSSSMVHDTFFKAKSN